MIILLMIIQLMIIVTELNLIGLQNILSSLLNLPGLQVLALKYPNLWVITLKL